MLGHGDSMYPSCGVIKTISPLQSFYQKIYSLHIVRRKASDKSPIQGHFIKHLMSEYSLKLSRLSKTRRVWNCHNQEELKEMGQLNAMCSYFVIAYYNYLGFVAKITFVSNWFIRFLFTFLKFHYAQHTVLYYFQVYNMMI